MAEIISQAHVSTESFRERSFIRKDDPYSGFTFAVKENDDIDFDAMSDGARENFQFCIDHPDTIIDEGIITRTYDIPMPARMRCDCGEEFELVNDYYGAYQCPCCKQWYNGSAQHLNPPETWDEDDLF
jgi:hypothetical protein